MLKSKYLLLGRSKRVCIGFLKQKLEINYYQVPLTLSAHGRVSALPEEIKLNLCVKPAMISFSYAVSEVLRLILVVVRVTKG